MTDLQSLRKRHRHERNGVMHAVIGVHVPPGIRLLWTVCGAYDVPANKAFTSDEPVTCPECIALEPKEQSNAS